MLLLPLLFLALGCVESPVGTSPNSAITADFITVWEAYEITYPEFTIKSINWELSYGKYLPMAESATTYEELMMNAVLPMLSELEDGHIWLIDPENVMIRTYFPEIFNNYSESLLNTYYFSEYGFTGYSTGVGYCNPDSLPYLSINSWKHGLNIGIVDEFVELCQDKPGIIIDVRMNGGGSDFMIPKVVGRFTLEECPGWLIRERSGPDYEDCTNAVFNNTPMGPMQYQGEIYLLIGQHCASSSEEFVAMMHELPNVTLIGDTTFGATIAPEWKDLPSGWSYTLGTWSGRTVRDEPIEWYGIVPDIVLDVTEEDFQGEEDPILEYAIDLIEEL